MLKTFTLLFACLMGVHTLFAQTPSISFGNSPLHWWACVDAPYSLPVIVNGQFDAENKFSIQVRNYDTDKEIAVLPAVLSGNVLQFTFTDASRYVNPIVKFRILSTAPKSESAWTSYGFEVFSKGKVSLSSTAKTDTLNEFDPLSIRLEGFSTSSGRATLNDSTLIEFAGSRSQINMVQNIAVTRQEAYTIAHAENTCGAMDVSGQVKVVVNKTSLRTISIMPIAACVGSEVKLGFSTSGPALPAQTRFKVRFSKLNYNNEKISSIDVPAELRDNYVVAKFPDSFGLSDPTPFTASILTENPSLVDNASRLQFTAWPQPQAVFYSQSFTSTVGESVYLQMTVKGIPPITVELNDGSKETISDQGIMSFTLNPAQTTAYSVKSVTTGCQNPAFTGNQSVEIKMNPGIIFKDKQKSNVICAGSKASVQFQSNAEFTDSTTFLIETVNNYTGEKLSFPATRSGDNLEFVIPQRTEGYGYTGLTIVTTNPSMVSRRADYFQIQTIPKVSFTNYNGFTYDKPTDVKLFYSLRGGAPYTVEQQDGSKFTILNEGEQVYNLYLKQDTNFRFKSIDNGCFKNENTASQQLQIKLTTETGLYLEPVKKEICVGDSIEVTFGKTGNFNSGNAYLVQAYVDCCDYQTIGTVSEPGTYKFRLTSDKASQDASIRIASTNPVVFSPVQTLNIHKAVHNFSIYPQGTEEEPAIIYSYNLPGTIRINSEDGVTTSFDYLENGVLKTVENKDNNSASIPLNPVFGKVNTYEFKSVSNACGTFPLDLKTYIRANPYEILIQNSGYGYNVCAGAPLSVVVISDNTDATYSIQLSKTGKDFDTILSGAKSRFLQTIVPANTEAGKYFMRVITTDGAISPMVEINISAVPTATIASMDQSNLITVEAGNQATLKVNLSGGGIWAVVYENNTLQNYNAAESQRWIQPVSDGKYWIKSVSNSCGYGTASGSIDVQVKPALFFNPASTHVACEGTPFSVNYKLSGITNLTDDYIRFRLVDVVNNISIQLDSTRILAGNRVLQLPALLPNSRYMLECSVRKYDLYFAFPPQVMSRPEVVINGNTTINAGEKAKLRLLTLKDTYGVTSYTLSDGTRGFTSGFTGAMDYITVMPTASTTYTITSLTNFCGAGIAAGAASVEVNPASPRSITVSGIRGVMANGGCAGDTILVTYRTRGTFTAGNKMTVQISDSTGKNFQNVTTLGNASPLRAIIPLNFADGNQFRIRAVASDSNSSAGAFEELVSIMHKARARFASDNVVFDENSNPKLTVLLEGSLPMKFRVGTDVGFQDFEAMEPTKIIELYQASPDVYFRLYSVQNSCGTGIVNKPSIVRSKMIIGPDVPPLPVTLASFSVKKEKRTAWLTWTTASETQSQHFEIQHSTNGKSWNTLTIVNASGESQDSVHYQYVHESPVLGSENLYRLKMVDTDESYTFSKIKSLIFDVDASLVTFPNPASETLTIQYNDWKNVTNIQLLNSNTVSVFDSGQNPSGYIDVSKLPAGLYLMKMTKANKSTLVQKIIIAR